MPFLPFRCWGVTADADAGLLALATTIQQGAGNGEAIDLSIELGFCLAGHGLPLAEHIERQATFEGAGVDDPPCGPLAGLWVLGQPLTKGRGGGGREAFPVEQGEGIAVEGAGQEAIGLVSILRGA